MEVTRKEWPKDAKRIISLKKPRLAEAPYYDVAILTSACPQCTSDIACIYADFYSADYCDNFAHICMNMECDFLVHVEQFDCNMGGGRCVESSNSCLFCGRPVEMTW